MVFITEVANVMYMSIVMWCLHSIKLQIKGD
jgi:hypothetical protein